MCSYKRLLAIAVKLTYPLQTYYDILLEVACDHFFEPNAVAQT